MAFNSGRDSQDAMAEINMTPLVDVMLVLLIIFMIAVPVITQSIEVNLPKVQTVTENTPQDAIALDLKLDGSLWWNKQQLSYQELTEKFKTIAQTEPQPTIELYADGDLAYKSVVKVMALAQQQGVIKLGFVTEQEKSSSVSAVQ
ncbi:ExbD/TolR family protein [Thalassotalea marina]|uniref:Biopolymer transporter ExbD n=1 Tax=Thalassotalea marina TaxID=1673741 RepID=A0A919EJF1_9GAMM|nr:biopolymer transporter ExbD [Thalassotalea marina]GHF88049.1 biopolymer transporter ExbD [Thalassotalea marina]